MAKAPTSKSSSAKSAASLSPSAKSSDGKDSNGKGEKNRLNNGGAVKVAPVVETPTPDRIPAESLVPRFSTEDRTALQGTLQTALYDTIHLALVVKQTHWNIVGPSFKPVHEFLDEIYEDVQESSDEIAERLVTLGMSPNGQGPEVVANTKVRVVPAGFIRDMEGVRLVAERLHTTSEDLRDVLEPIEDVDSVTADMLHGIIETFEKHLWMLRAHLI